MIFVNVTSTFFVIFTHWGIVQVRAVCEVWLWRNKNQYFPVLHTTLRCSRLFSWNPILSVLFLLPSNKRSPSHNICASRAYTLKIHWNRFLDWFFDLDCMKEHTFDIVSKPFLKGLRGHQVPCWWAITRHSIIHQFVTSQEGVSTQIGGGGQIVCLTLSHCDVIRDGFFLNSL